MSSNNTWGQPYGTYNKPFGGTERGYVQNKGIFGNYVNGHQVTSKSYYQ